MQNATGTVGLQVCTTRRICTTTWPSSSARLPELGDRESGQRAPSRPAAAQTWRSPAKRRACPRGVHHRPGAHHQQRPCPPRSAGARSTMNVHGLRLGRSRTSLPTLLALSQNVPNPFNPEHEDQLRASGRSGLVDAARVRRARCAGPHARRRRAGTPAMHDYLWDGVSDEGVQVPSGVYFYRLRTAEGDHHPEHDARQVGTSGCCRCPSASDGTCGTSPR
jgi:hypothetical protein